MGWVDRIVFLHQAVGHAASCEDRIVCLGKTGGKERLKCCEIIILCGQQVKL